MGDETIIVDHEVINELNGDLVDLVQRSSDIVMAGTRVATYGKAFFREHGHPVEAIEAINWYQPEKLMIGQPPRTLTIGFWVPTAVVGGPWDFTIGGM